jgi:hypothetical protein
MTEFVGLDLEMAIEEHYHEVLDLFDNLFVSIFKGLKTQYAKELDAVKIQFPFEDFEFLEPTLRLEFKDAVKMLRDAGVEMGDYDDLSYAFSLRALIVAGRRMSARSANSSRKSTRRTFSCSTSSRWPFARSIRCQTPAIRYALT